MIRTIINAPTLAKGVKYPAPVAKAYTAQLDAQTKFEKDLAALTVAEAAVISAGEQDRVAMLEAVDKGTGPVKANRADQAEQARRYAEQVAERSQAEYVAAAEATRAELATHAEEILPASIEYARACTIQYEEQIKAGLKMIHDAADVMSQATLAVNLLNPYIPYSNYSANFVPLTVSLDVEGRLANVRATLDRLEQSQHENTNPTARSERFPVAVTAQSYANADIYSS